LDDSLAADTFMSAAQCASLLGIVRSSDLDDYRFYHVVCYRCIEPWRLNNAQHGIGHCYYGGMEFDYGINASHPYVRAIDARSAVQSAINILTIRYSLDINNGHCGSGENFGHAVRGFAIAKVAALKVTA
jgi:hypothetical protein